MLLALCGILSSQEPPFIVSLIIRAGNTETVLKSALGMVILEPREVPETDSGWIYVVVTAYSKRNPHGVQIGRIV